MMMGKDIKQHKDEYMQSRELFRVIAQGKFPPRVPFVPTLFEHGARVIGKTPAQTALSRSLLVESQLACYELYRHDLVSVGLDVYNIEAEALGIKIDYPASYELPSAKDVCITCREDLEGMKIPDPSQDGRMPMIIEACRDINEKIGSHVAVNGTVTGPFTLAAILRGFESFIMDLIYDPEFAALQMSFAKGTALRYAQAIFESGVGLSVNESWIAPPLLSPSLFRCMVLPLEQKFIQDLKAVGYKSIALISGGNTTPIAEDLVSTGTSLLMADYMTDQSLYKDICRQHAVLLRASIDPQVVEKGTDDEMRRAAAKVFDACSDYHGFLFGCGIVSYNTLPQRVIKLKEIIEDASIAHRFIRKEED